MSGEDTHAQTPPTSIRLRVPGGEQNGDTTSNDDSGNGADDVIDETISDKPLPSTGGPSLLGLAVISLGLAVLGGATVVRTGVRRRDR